MPTDNERACELQGNRKTRRKRSREDREKRDAAFTSKRLGRPKGSRLAFFDDDDRFAVALVHCIVVFRGKSLYHAADLAVALTSSVPLEASSIGDVAKGLNRSQAETHVRFTGGPAHATLKGAAGALVAKVKAPRTRAEGEWIRLSAAALDTLIDLLFSPRPALDASYVRVAFDFLHVRGWTPMLTAIVGKISLAAKSNFPPAEEPPTRRTIDLLWPKSKSKS
jgi:hypothetical protein